MYKKIFCFVFVFIIAGAFLCAKEGKIRVAVLDFNTDALHGSWNYSWHYSKLATAAADNLTTELVKQGELSVIERQKLDAILQEQQLGASGAVDTSTAAKIGNVLGVQLIVTGSVTSFGVSEWGGNVPQIGKWKFGRGISGKMYKGKCSLNARLVDTTSAEILGAYEAESTKKFGEGSFAGASFGKSYDSGMVSKVLAKAIDKVASKITKDAKDIEPATGISGSGGLEGKIAKVSDSKIYTNLGSGDGVESGDTFKVLRPGEEIVDPETGESLGSETSEIGTVTITTVKKKFSIAKAKSGTGFQKGDILKEK